MATLIIAAHKQFKPPADPAYLPVFVGAALHEWEEDVPPYLPDNTGDNISLKNPLYCELTGLYFAWKNLKQETLGLVHYRRYFAGKGKDVLTSEALERILSEADVILPKKQNYVIETLYSHYKHTHDARQLDETRRIIEEVSPEYLESFDRVMKKRSAHMFNMMVMKQPWLDRYLKWLFEILFRLEKRFELKESSAYQRRYCGRIAEILLNVWLDREIRGGLLAKDRVAVLPVVYLGKVNWLKKGSAFLKAKFLHQRYKESF
ncbi:MAG: DUF4422 domain-containing protein [Lachnospiraceae bacterium]|nr:DUF4422 domain-containing protein [Lachnospiraceae bacterium]